MATPASALRIPTDLAQTVRVALAEDVGSGDVTASLIGADAIALAEVICREAAVIAGQPWFDEVYRAIDDRVAISWAQADGGQVASNTVVCSLRGPARAIVTGERTALNFLQTLSATATATRRYADALIGTKTRILDTRKTIPGLRTAQKYAVVCGGGKNHRMGLFDAVLIKENHIAAAGSITAAVGAIRASHPRIKIEVEVESMDELEQALAAQADMILLDNFAPEQVHAATAVVAGRAEIEISGGIEYDQLAAYGSAGADYISVGALTKHIRAIDFSMRIRN